MDRKKPLKRRKPINRRNAARMSKRFKRNYYSEAYVIAIKAMRCLICQRRPCHAHHVVTKAAGGDYKVLVPLCVVHHKELHDTGRKTFADKWKIDLTAKAEEVYDLLSPLRGEDG
tara:strand:+ start:397 stop:741 length:345 start_codon:yes stop_codon:yes gene_type:complete